jgi:hypothetical protein
MATLSVKINASGVSSAVTTIKAEISSIAPAAQRAGADAQAGFDKMAAALKRAEEAARSQNAVLQAKIPIQQQVLSGAISLAEGQRKLAEAEIFAKTQDQALAQALAKSKTEYAANAQAIRAMEQAQKQATQAGQTLSDGLRAVGASLLRIGEIVIGINLASLLAQARQQLVAMIRSAIDFSNTLEQGQIALGALLALSRQYTTESGVTASTIASYRTSLSDAAKIQQQLLTLSISTLGTAEELVETYQLVLAFSKGQQATDEARLTLSQNILNAGKLLGLNNSLIATEARQILTLERASGQQILSALGLTIQQARAYKEQGTLVTFLNERLKIFTDLSGDVALTWEGLTSTVKTFVQILEAQAFTSTFSALKEILRGMSEEFQRLRASGELFGSVIGTTDQDLRDLGAVIAQVIATIITEVAKLVATFVELTAAINQAFNPSSPTPFLTALEQVVSKVTNFAFQLKNLGDLSPKINFEIAIPTAGLGIGDLSKVIPDVDQLEGSLQRLQRTADAFLHIDFGTLTKEQFDKALLGISSFEGALTTAERGAASLRAEGKITGDQYKAFADQIQAARDTMGLLTGSFKTATPATVDHTKALKEAEQQARALAQANDTLAAAQNQLAEATAQATGDIAGLERAGLAALQAERDKQLQSAHLNAEARLAIEKTYQVGVQALHIKITNTFISELEKQTSAVEDAISSQSQVNENFFQAQETLRQSEADSIQTQLDLQDALKRPLEERLPLIERLTTLEVEGAQAAQENLENQIAAQRGLIATTEEAIRVIQQEIAIQAGNPAQVAALNTQLGEQNQLLLSQSSTLTKLEAEYIASGQAIKTAVLRGKSAFIDLNTEIAKLGSIDLKQSIDKVFDAIISGTRDLGSVFEGIGLDLAKQFGDSFLFGKRQSFDVPFKANALGLVGPGGLIGDIFGQGGLFAASSFGGAFINSLGGSLQGASGILNNAATTLGDLSQVTWTQVGGQSGATYAQGFLGGFGGFMAGEGARQLFGIGQSLAGDIGAGVGAVGGGIAGFIIGGPTGAAIGAALGDFFGGLIGDVFGDLFAHTPTLGTQIRKGIVEFLEEIEVSFANEIDSGDYFFDETKKLAEKMFGGDFLAASQQVLTDKAGPELAKQLQALGTFLTADQAQELGKSLEQTGTTFGNLLIDNLGLEAIPEAIDEIISKAGIDFTDIVEKLNSVFQHGAISAEFYKGAIMGAVDIFTQDLPSAINVSAIAMASFTDDGIFSLTMFQEKLEEAVSNFELIGEAFGSQIISGLEQGLDPTAAGQAFEDFMREAIAKAAIAKLVADELDPILANLDLSQPLSEDDLAFLRGEFERLRGLSLDIWDAWVGVADEVGDAVVAIDRLAPEITMIESDFQKISKQGEKWVDALTKAHDLAGEEFVLTLPEIEELAQEAQTFEDQMRSAFSSGVTQGILDGLLAGQNFDPAVLATTIQANVYRAVLQGIIDALIQSAIITPIITQAMAPFTAAITTAMANGVISAAEMTVILTAGKDAIAQIPGLIAAGMGIVTETISSPEFQDMLDELRALTGGIGGSVSVGVSGGGVSGGGGVTPTAPVEEAVDLMAEALEALQQFVESNTTQTLTTDLAALEAESHALAEQLRAAAIASVPYAQTLLDHAAQLESLAALYARGGQDRAAQKTLDQAEALKDQADQLLAPALEGIADELAQLATVTEEARQALIDDFLEPVQDFISEGLGGSSGELVNEFEAIRSSLEANRTALQEFGTDVDSLVQQVIDSFITQLLEPINEAIGNVLTPVVEDLATSLARVSSAATLEELEAASTAGLEAIQHRYDVERDALEHQQDLLGQLIDAREELYELEREQIENQITALEEQQRALQDQIGVLEDQRRSIEESRQAVEEELRRIEQERQAIEQLRDAAQGLRDQVAQFQFARLTPEQQASSLRQQIQATAPLAATGDLEAIQHLSQLTNQLHQLGEQALQTAEQLRDAAQNLRDAAEQARFARLSAQEQAGQLRKQILGVAQAAKGGDLEALQQLPQLTAQLNQLGEQALQTAEQLRDTAQGFRDMVEQMHFARLSAAEQAGQLRKQILGVAQAAKGGDLAALDKLPQLTDALSQLGEEALDTAKQIRDAATGFRDMVEQMHFAELSAQEQIVSLRRQIEETARLASAGDLAALDKLPQLTDALSQLGEEAQAAAESMRDAAQSLRDAAEEALLGDQSFLLPQDRLEALRQQVLDTAAAAQGGDVEAAKRLPQLTDALNQLAQELFASGQPAQDIFAFTQDILRKTADHLDQAAAGQQQQADNINAFIEKILTDTAAAAEAAADREEARGEELFAFIEKILTDTAAAAEAAADREEARANEFFAFTEQILLSVADQADKLAKEQAARATEIFAFVEKILKDTADSVDHIADRQEAILDWEEEIQRRELAALNLQDQAIQSRIDQLNLQIAQLDTQRDQLELQLDQLEEQHGIADSTDKIAALNDKIASLNAELGTTNEQSITDLQDLLDTYPDKIDALETQLTADLLALQAAVGSQLNTLLTNTTVTTNAIDLNETAVMNNTTAVIENTKKLNDLVGAMPAPGAGASAPPWLSGLGAAIADIPHQTGLRNVGPLAALNTHLAHATNTILYETSLQSGFGGAHTPFTEFPLPFAQGGIVTRPTLAMIGEAGPEAIIPLFPGGQGKGKDDLLEEVRNLRKEVKELRMSLDNAQINMSLKVVTMDEKAIHDSVFKEQLRRTKNNEYTIHASGINYASGIKR